MILLSGAKEESPSRRCGSDGSRTCLRALDLSDPAAAGFFACAAREKSHPLYHVPRHPIPGSATISTGVPGLPSRQAVP